MKNYDWLVENGIVDMVYDQIDKKYGYDFGNY